MSAKKQLERTCNICKYDGGWHYDDAGDAIRCANYYAADAQREAQKLTADAHTRAFQAAKQIIADTAETLPELNGNTVRDAMEAAQIPSGVIGAAFSACVRDGVLEASGRYVQSTEATTRHKIAIWSSRVYRGAVAS